ncbi:(Lyso)-N-acylphosphatidylethanolamine lipase isoform X2 [Musca domestica]|nr:(Lyso)-N-acylphosphatidylethanolamine lipase isoform X2 [Musca domestica]XP_058976165.1 (Lyso)-N-acylphosphatidylethanolamine lipase isoform X2 [Musca domestica]XP_058976166.1 (Lyso)-N-acylphosphatidylethanolamine lipase isoform X2 [Musca domestica]
MLRAVEKKILSFLKTPYRGFFVDIGPAIGESDKIWTVSFNTESKEVPLVMLHGLGAGVALWVMNFDALAKDRPVYAIDILGFGRSSRPKFSNDALTCEKQFVKSVEEWRREMNIKNMILLGHSMGGFIASSYALSYPDRVKHLILADPWGFPEKPSDALSSKQIPLWVRALAHALTPLNPLWALRAAGPFGQWVVQKTRPDIMRKFSSTIEDDINLIPQYIHQCNAQYPSGESAFHTMMESFGWAKHPMIHRIKDVRHDIPMTFIYGTRSWIDSSSGEKIKAQRGDSIVDIKVVNGAGHHVYADKPEIFNRYVNETCDLYKIRQLIRDSTESDEEHANTSGPEAHSKETEATEAESESSRQQLQTNATAKQTNENSSTSTALKSTENRTQ